MGKVVETDRAKAHLWGAHVSRRKRNVFALGICLVGNFDETTVPDEQLASAISLTRSLMSKYGIPAENVTLHGETEGESSRCPGKNFPKEQFMRGIS